MPRNASVSVSGELAEKTARVRPNWAELLPHMNVNPHVCTYTNAHRRCQNPRVCKETQPPTVQVPRTGRGLFCACALTAFSPPPPRWRPAPERILTRPLPLPFPSPAALAEHCGTQTKCPQTGWSERSGNGRGAGPHARGGGSLPTSPSPPLTPLPLPHPAPSRKREPSPRSPNRRLPSANRPQRPPARGSPGPLAPPLRPLRAPRVLPSRRFALSHLAGTLLVVPPCPSHRLSTGLGAAARDRVPSASRGRREAASRALRPLPPGCRRRRRRHLAASAWRGGGGGAPGLRAPAPPPSGNGEGRASGPPGLSGGNDQPVFAARALGMSPPRG